MQPRPIDTPHSRNLVIVLMLALQLARKAGNEQDACRYLSAGPQHRGDHADLALLADLENGDAARS